MNYPTKTKKIKIETKNGIKEITIYEMPIKLIYKLKENEEIEVLEILKECTDKTENEIIELPYSALTMLNEEIFSLTYGKDVKKK